MRLIVDGKTKELSTKIAWQKSRWSQQQGIVIGNSEDSRKLNSYLEPLQMKVLQAKQVMLDKEKDITAEGIKNLLLGKSEEYKMLLEVFADHNRKMESLLGTTITRPLTPGDGQTLRPSRLSGGDSIHEISF